MNSYSSYQCHGGLTFTACFLSLVPDNLLVFGSASRMSRPRPLSTEVVFAINMQGAPHLPNMLEQLWSTSSERQRQAVIAT